jgi:hypothetical protein
MFRTEPKHSTAFIVFFAIIALAINSVQFRELERERVAQQSRQLAAQAQADAQTTIQETAAAHVQYVAQYVNPGFTKTSGIKSLALVVVNQNGAFDPTIGNALQNHFKSDTVKISTSLLKPNFVSEGLFTNLFDGSTDILKKLDLANSLDAVLLAREDVQFVNNPASLDNVLTANMTLEIQIVPVSSGIQNTTWKYTATGAGFSQFEAEANAKERLIKHINNDTTLSLSN